MGNESIQYVSNRVELAENAMNGNLVAKFCLCDFGVNHNGVKLNRDTIEPWVGSLVNQPLVGRIGYNGDFTGHNMRVSTITNSEGEQQQEVVFDTEAIGTFTSAGIEEIDGEDYVVGTAEIWKRYPNVCNLIAERVSEGTLHTSWEILVTESHMEGNVKVIDNGTFTALCALGKSHPPAYDSSQLLEVAESDEDLEFAQAISNDVANFKTKEESSMDNEAVISAEAITSGEIVAQVSEATVETTAPSEEPVLVQSEESEPETVEEPATEPEVSNEGPEVSALTEIDLVDKVGKAIREQAGVEGYVSFLFPEEHAALVRVFDPEYSELEFMQFNYSVSNDTVTVGEGTRVRLEANPVAMSEILSQKNDALVEASQRIKGLEAELAELRPFKEAAEKAEAERLAAEKQEKVSALERYALKSGFITSEEIAAGDVQAMIAELNETGIKQLIAERFMESLNEEPVAETAEKKETVEVAELNLEVSDDEDANILSVYNKKLY